MQLPHAAVVSWNPCTSGLGASPACGDATYRSSLLPWFVADLTQKRCIGSWRLYSSTLEPKRGKNGGKSLHRGQRGVCVAWIGQSADGPSRRQSGQSTRKEAVKVATRDLERQHLDGYVSDDQQSNGAADEGQYFDGVESNSRHANRARFGSEQNGFGSESEDESEDESGVADESHMNGVALENQDVNETPSGQQADGVSLRVEPKSQIVNEVIRCKRTNRIASESQRRCAICLTVKSLLDFQKAGKGRRKECRACVAADLAKRSGRPMYHMTMSSEEAWVRAKACSTCGVVKELRDFPFGRDRTHGPRNRCRACDVAIADNNRHVLEAAAALRQLLESKQRLNNQRRQCGELSGALDKALEAKAVVEEKLEFLSTAVAQAQTGEKMLRESIPELKKEVSRWKPRKWCQSCSCSCQSPHFCRCSESPAREVHTNEMIDDTRLSLITFLILYICPCVEEAKRMCLLCIAPHSGTDYASMQRPLKNI